MIYIFHGSDSFSINEALKRRYEEIGPRELWDSNLAELNGKSFDSAQFIAVAQVVPFLAAKRIVVISGLISAAQTSSDSRRKRPKAAITSIRRTRKSQNSNSAESVAAELIGLLEGLPVTTDVFFVDPELNSSNPLLKQLAPLAEILEFPNLRKEALEGWVKTRTREKEGSITKQAVEKLVDLVGNDLWLMDAELEKLTTYCIGRDVDVDDVMELVTSAREANVFVLIDAVVEGKKEQAFLLLERLNDAGYNETRLLGLIARQAGLLAIAHELINTRVPQSEWKDRLRLNNDFVLRKTVQQARNLSRDRIRKLFRLLFEADLAIKTGELDPDLAVMNMVTQMINLEKIEV